MRFLFENGGRSGMRDAEALADHLETCGMHEEGHQWGTLLVDFAATNDQPGEVFRTVDQWQAETREAFLGRKEWQAALKVLAFQYWAEAEAMELARTVKPPKRRGRKSKSTRI